MNTDKPTLDQVITYLTHRLDGMTMPGAVRMTTAARDYLVELQAENEKLRAELEQVKRENDALWIYIEIVDREYQRYMDRGYIDRLDELKRTWRRGQKEG